ncbi:MAG: S-layer homology domain-containing protein [Peptostreptococcaceae bacterium]|nr:S-layer homology domain-containing protein [Peptostreptococcaceae bacterium]
MRKLINCIRKWVAIVTFICILCTLVSVNAYASSVSDITGHWAKDTIQNWVDQGIVNGYEDGTFRPENSISRAEFMSLVNGIFGYITGYPEGTMRPDNLITREEVASILMKITGLDGNEAAAGVFNDSKAVTWSKGAIGAVYSAKIMAGYPDGSFKGQNNIKRCEALVALDKAALKKAGTPVETQSGVNYIALGDSIAYGSKVAKGFGYVDLFYDGMKKETGNVQPMLLNLGKPGKNSSELLASLKTDKATIDAVLKADIITISIGGNNLLRPVTTGIAAEFKLDSRSATFNRDLALLLTSETNRDKLKTVLTGVALELDAGVQQFAKDWPEIVKTLRALSPQFDVHPTRRGYEEIYQSHIRT